MKLIYTRLKSEGYAATIAPDGSVNNNADYTCPGTDDDVTINTAITTVSENGGGEIKLLPGTFNLSDSIEVAADVIINGSGIGATLINQTSTTAPAFLLSDADQSGITDLQIKIPTNSTGNGITTDDCTAYHLHRLTFQGGSADSWMVEDNAGFNFHYQVLKASHSVVWRGGGLHFTNDTAYNTGNALVEFFEYMMRYNNTTGIFVEGTTSPGKNVNLIQFTGLNIVNFQGTATGTKAIDLYRANYLTFNMCDIEAHDNGVYMDNSACNLFNGVYISGNDVGILNSASGSYNNFMGGHIGDTITDDQSNDAKKLKLYGGDYGD